MSPNTVTPTSERTTKALNTTSRRPGRRSFSAFSPSPAPKWRPPTVSTPLTPTPPRLGPSRAPVQYHPEQVRPRLQEVVDGLAGQALRRPGGVHDEQDTVEAVGEVGGGDHPAGDGAVHDDEVPALLEGAHGRHESLAFGMGGGAGGNGAGRHHQEAWCHLVSVVFEGLVAFEAAGEAPEVRLAQHPVELGDAEVAVHEPDPPPHAGRGAREAHADARAPRPVLRARDYHAADPLQGEQPPGEVFVVAPDRR